MTETFTVRCPHCRSANVEPRGEFWYCNDCEKTFAEAAVEMPTPAPNPKATKRRK